MDHTLRFGVVAHTLPHAPSHFWHDSLHIIAATLSPYSYP